MFCAGLLALISYGVPSLNRVVDAPLILFLGALAASLPGCVFSVAVLIITQRKPPKVVAFVLCVSELIKLLAVSAAIGWVLIHYPDHMLLALAGFFGMWIVSLLAYFICKPEGMK